jgi:cytochrome P450 family 6
MLSGSTVEVKETMAKFTTDIVASCAFGMKGNTLNDADSEFGRHVRGIANFSVQKGLAMLFAFFAPYLNTIFGLKFVGDKTNNYLRQVVRDAVHYR